jgi:hypothetical protein
MRINPLKVLSPDYAKVITLSHFQNAKASNFKGGKAIKQRHTEGRKRMQARKVSMQLWVTQSDCPVARGL